MLIGAGVSMIPGVGPLMAAGLVGGGYGLATGSLKEGLKAGLGAYGGAGLGSALAGAGVQASVAPQLAQTQAGIAELAGAVPASGLTPAMVPDYAASILGKTQPYVDASNAATTAFQNAGPLEKLKTMGSGLSNLGSGAGRDAFMTQIGGTKGLGMAGLAAAAPMLLETTTKQPDMKQDTSLGQRYKFNAGTQTPTPNPDVPGYDNQGRNFGKEQKYFNPSYMPIDDATAKSMYGYASGGPVEAMSDANAIGMNTGYPQAAIDTGAYATPYQQPISRNVVTGPQGVGMNPYTGQAQFAEGGISNLGDYSDGGRLLRGPGDGISDSIPAMIGKKQPARLADGEFVVPARIVSELGNGSTEAGARKLYAMMDRIQKARGKTVGKGKVAANSRSAKYLPA
jgi:hypothetical protein